MSEEAIALVKVVASVGLAVFVIGLCAAIAFMDHDKEKECHHD